jgi:hypothetical protein
MAITSDRTDQMSLQGEPAGNRKVILIFIASAVFFLIVFALMAGNFLSDDNKSAGEGSGSQQEDTRAKP